MENSKKYLIAAAFMITAMSGAALGISLNAIQSNAQEITTADVQPTRDRLIQSDPVDQKKGGHVGSNGIKEEILTGDTAQKVTEAANKAEPGATINRVETDAEGDKYEAHITKSDGTRATLKFDENFNLTKTESGKR